MGMHTVRERRIRCSGCVGQNLYWLGKVRATYFLEGVTWAGVKGTSLLQCEECEKLLRLWQGKDTAGGREGRIDQE